MSQSAAVMLDPTNGRSGMAARLNAVLSPLSGLRLIGAPDMAELQTALHEPSSRVVAVFVFPDFADAVEIARQAHGVLPAASIILLERSATPDPDWFCVQGIGMNWTKIPAARIEENAERIRELAETAMKQARMQTVLHAARNQLRPATARFSVESLLKHDMPLFELAVNASPAAMLMVDQDGVIVFSNDRAIHLLGYTRAEFIGRPIHFLVPARFRQGHKDMLAHFMSDPSARLMGESRDLTARCSDGTEVPVEIGLNPVRTDHGMFVLASIVDISERKRFVDALTRSERRYRAQSERLKLAFTSSINIMEDLQLRGVDLESANARQKLLLREVHHRVKNNMQLIISLLRLQMRSSTEPGTAALLNETVSRIRAMAQVHETLHRSEEQDLIDASAFLSSLVESLEQTSGAASRSVRCRVSVSGPAFDINEATYCGLIVNELVSNALKHAFSERESGEVEVVLSAGGDTGRVLIVRDNGCGLPESPDTAQSNSLGLQIVFTLVESQLGGRIEINREFGTEFRITFTRAKAPEGAKVS